MFKFSQVPDTQWHEVKARIRQKGIDVYRDASIKIELKILGIDEVEEKRNELQQRVVDDPSKDLTIEWCKEFIVDWEGPKEEDDSVMEFTENNLLRMLNVYEWRKAFTETVLEGVTRAKFLRGN